MHGEREADYAKSVKVRPSRAKQAQRAHLEFRFNTVLSAVLLWAASLLGTEAGPASMCIVCMYVCVNYVCVCVLCVCMCVWRLLDLAGGCAPFWYWMCS